MFNRRRSVLKLRSGTVPVYLNVYDLTTINAYAYWFGLGVYHSGVQVHGVEYAYGAHEYPSTGIFESEPRSFTGFSLRKSILIGKTDLGKSEVRDIMDELAHRYTGNTYDLISKNCNHFCNDACLRLTGNATPRWVNRLAKLGLLCKCVLPAQVTAVRCRTENETDSTREGERLRLTSGSVPYVGDNDGEDALSQKRRRRSSRGSRRASALSAADAGRVAALRIL